jgi:choline dehydrogenase
MISIASNWTGALAGAGIPPAAAPNAGTPLGAFIAPSSINPANWTRSYSRSAYLDALPPRANLHVLPGATVVRLLFSPDNETDAAGALYATGVEFAAVAAAPRVTVGVRREAVLAGGALGSAKVLMLSGVGPADVLGNASVQVRRALPGVGQNLQDHLVGWACVFGTASRRC